MTSRSKYDELHDRYHSMLSGKGGTRYERLAAMLFKILEAENVVVHDIKLIGDSTVPHQIEILIEVDGKKASHRLPNATEWGSEEAFMSFSPSFLCGVKRCARVPQGA